MSPFRSLRDYELFVYSPHKHVPPDVKHHRVPAPDIGFIPPNLPFLIQEVKALPPG